MWGCPIQEEHPLRSTPGTLNLELLAKLQKDCCRKIAMSQIDPGQGPGQFSIYAIDSMTISAPVPVGSVTRETRIWHDLHLMWRRRCVEVFTGYQDKFGVDLSSLRWPSMAPLK